MPPDGIEHRRLGDGELLGWMVPVGEGFVVVDLLGRRRSAEVEWLTAEETLDGLGLSYLADPYELRQDDGSWLRVRIAEVTPDEVRLQRDEWGGGTAVARHYSLPLPVDEGVLRPLS